MNPADCSPLTPRVTARDAGETWEWTDPQGFVHQRAKSNGPLPAVVTEVHHARAHLRDRDMTRGILLLPPTINN